jgi:hypothetical protein
LVAGTGYDVFSREEVQMLKRFAALWVVCGALLLAFAAPAVAFTVEHPVSGECRQVLIPGPTTFPGNWEVVSNTPAEGPGPWNAHMLANENTALGPVICE